MANMLADGSRWLEERRTEHCTEEVTYVRGTDSVVVKATIGRTRFETDDDGTVRLDYTDRDYLILVDDLILSGSAITPKPGDRIEEADGSGTLVFEVTDWRYSDPFRNTFRIETQFIGTK